MKLKTFLESKTFLYLAIALSAIIVILAILTKKCRRKSFNKYYKDPKLEEKYSRQNDDSISKSGLLSNMFKSKADQKARKGGKVRKESLYADVFNEKTGTGEGGSSSIGFSKFTHANRNNIELMDEEMESRSGVRNQVNGFTY